MHKIAAMVELLVATVSFMTASSFRRGRSPVTAAAAASAPTAAPNSARATSTLTAPTSTTSTSFFAKRRGRMRSTANRINLVFDYTKQK